MSVINQFIDDYIKKFEFYREAARICAQICETNMEQMGIRTIVTSRAKKPERLKDKLEKRIITKNYKSSGEIAEDVADLAGVRISLYFPGDLYKVHQFIEGNFLVKECRKFPEELKLHNDMSNEYNKRFSGYWATHYRVYIKDKDIPEEYKKYANTLIEIQVASLLMHAWAEVEHDLLYKPFSGEISSEEYQILDELNGLVLVGEIALQRLQKAVKNRVSEVGKDFNNHYELAMFLYNKLGSPTQESKAELVLGRVDLLFNSIKATHYNKPETLKELIISIEPDTRSKPIVEQIMDKIKALDPEIFEKYKKLKQSEELKYQKDTLHINRENGNRQGEANTLANIGYIYRASENFDEAIIYFMEAVKINHEIGGVQGEANQLLNLGSTYRIKGDLNKALEYCYQAVELHKRINYKQGQANTLGLIGNIFADRNDFNQAMHYYEEALSIYRETNYRIGEVTLLNSVGALYIKQNDINQALQYYEQALKLCSECDYKQGEGEALHNIGNIYLERGYMETALIHYKKALTLQEVEGNQKNQIGVLLSIGNAYKKQGQLIESMKYYKKALQLSNNIDYINGTESARSNIAQLEINE
jgi:ppGpp synthetase/RelA/SpoT-type nucleotidyltranferase/Tfp pilus assembly protein PilF